MLERTLGFTIDWHRLQKPKHSGKEASLSWQIQDVGIFKFESYPQKNFEIFKTVTQPHKLNFKNLQM